MANQVMEKFSVLSYLIANKITVTSDFINQEYDAKVLEFSSEIEANWLKEKNAKGDSLTNGSILNLGFIEKEEEHLILKCHSIEYKHFLAQRSGLKLGIRPLAVSGITFYHSKGQKVFLLARRSVEVTQFPGMLELIPSGSIDVLDRTSVSTQIDFKGELIRELAEEIGVTKDQTISSKEFCLLRDEENVFDIGVEIEIIQGASIKVNLEEYSELKEMNFNSLDGELEKSKTLKTSKTLFKAWCKYHE